MLFNVSGKFVCAALSLRSLRPTYVGDDLIRYKNINEATK